MEPASFTKKNYETMKDVFSSSSKDISFGHSSASGDTPNEGKAVNTLSHSLICSKGIAVALLALVTGATFAMYHSNRSFSHSMSNYQSSMTTSSMDFVPTPMLASDTIDLSKEASVKVKCKNVYMPELIASLNIYKKSRICYPDDGNKYPLHFFGHGDFGGGPFSFAYDGLLKDIVRQGMVVCMYLSCAIDKQCDNGNGSFMEILKSMSFLETNTGWWNDKIDFDIGYSASGHSTGGRAVLMLAALIDNPTKYLANTKYAALITSQQRTSIQKFQAIIGDHPDPIYAAPLTYLDNFVVDKLPVMIVTGSSDRIEPKLSAWKDFRTITTPEKVYVNMLDSGHLGPLLGHKEGPYIAYFSQCWISKLDDAGTCAKIYGSGSDAMVNTLSIATTGDRNTGDGKVGFLTCGDGGYNPHEFANYCEPKSE